MRILAENTAALIVDAQEKLMPAMWNAESCEKNIVKLAKGLKVLNIPLMITQQYTKGLGYTLPSVYEAAGTTAYFDKTSFSCCNDREIMDALYKLGKKNILVMGTEAHVCVLLTCLDLKTAGFQPVLVVDGVGSRKESDMNIGITRAMQEGILVTSVETALFSLTESAKHPDFKLISNIVKE